MPRSCATALPALWSQQTFTITFQERTISGLRAEPWRPSQPVHRDTWVGAAAARRAVTLGKGWFGWSMSLPGESHEHQDELLAFVVAAPKTLLA